MSDKIERRFIPSNGTEGMIFMEEFCDHCIHERWMHFQNEDKEEDKCQILSNSMIHYRPCYDKDLKFDGWEWFDNGDFSEHMKNYRWKCNQYKYWDWDNDDRDDKRPKLPPYDPNQLVMFTFDEKVDELIAEEIKEEVSNG